MSLRDWSRCDNPYLLADLRTLCACTIRANPLRKASGSCLSLAKMSTALLSVHSGFQLGYNGGGGGGVGLTLLGLHVCLLIISLIIFFFIFLFSPV